MEDQRATQMIELNMWELVAQGLAEPVPDSEPVRFRITPLGQQALEASK